MSVKLSRNRNLGLDLIRSIAILLVLLSHGRHFFPSINLQVLSFGGFYGVEMFFVLSGYLIGIILIKSYINIDNVGTNWLLKFYISRWFRTFPLYFILLLLFSLLGNNFGWQYYVFLQNFNEIVLNKWAVTWSLSIEEWFYICTPLLLIVGCRFFSRKHAYLFVILTIIIFEISMRVILWLNSNIHSMSEFRKTIYLQMDSLAIGMLLAYINSYKFKLYSILSTSYCFMAGMALVVLTFIIYAYYGYGDHTYENSFFCSSVYFDFAALSVFLTIPFISEKIIINNIFTKVM